MIKSIAHLCILTRDLGKTETFYCGCLGLTKKFDFIRDGEVAGFYFQINDANFIEIFKTDTQLSDQAPTIAHFCLEVDDIEAVIEHVRKRGVEITDKKMGCDRSWQAWLTDPNGIKIELHQYTDQSNQVVGGDCIINF